MLPTSPSPAAPADPVQAVAPPLQARGCLLSQGTFVCDVTGHTTAWATADFDDGGWERITHGFGPQFWLLGPLPAEAPEVELARRTRIDPHEPVRVDGKSYHWRPYAFSWRYGLEGDPGHQG
jgi:hypothetical protein